MPNPSPFRTLAALALLAVSASPSSAQFRRYSHRKHEEPHHRISAGAYAALGDTTSAQPTGRHGGVEGQVGIYAEYARHDLRPGIDARLAGQDFAVGLLSIDGAGIPNGTATEKLIGPRLSYAKGIAHPYVEALFGKGYESDISPRVYDPNTYASIYAHGLATYGVAGIDLDADSHLQFRLEYAAGRISSSNSFLIQNFTAGLVFRFP